MNKILHRADTRGVGDHDWLTSRFSFSFAHWYEPTRMGFGALRVLNDDTIAPRSGFGNHPHRDMEIITIVTKGAVTHKDSIGNTGVVKTGDVQVMSAGTGVVHSEYNDSPDEPLMLFQLWVMPNKAGVEPRYAQKSFLEEMTRPGCTLLAAPDSLKQGLPLYQRAFISWGLLDALHPLSYDLHGHEHGVYVFVVEGNVQVADETLAVRDALGISGVPHLSITSSGKASVLLIEVPLS